MMPFFAMYIVLWGAVHIETWKRKNARLTFFWYTEKFEEYEVELPAYTKKQQLRNQQRPHSKLKAFYYDHESRIKFLVSFLVFLGMVISEYTMHFDTIFPFLNLTFAFKVCIGHFINYIVSRLKSRL
jgi:hypothetical protein